MYFTLQIYRGFEKISIFCEDLRISIMMTISNGIGAESFKFQVAAFSGTTGSRAEICKFQLAKKNFR